MSTPADRLAIIARWLQAEGEELLYEPLYGGVPEGADVPIYEASSAAYWVANSPEAPECVGLTGPCQMRVISPEECRYWFAPPDRHDPEMPQSSNWQAAREQWIRDHSINGESMA